MSRAGRGAGAVLSLDRRQPVGLVRAAVYCRISQDTAGEGLGVERQEQACRELADRLGWEVAHVLVDNDVSAFSGARHPSWQRLLAMVRSGEVDGVLASHTDRMYRRIADLAEFIAVVERSGIEVRTVTAGEVDLSTASGRMVAKMIANIGEYESERVAERVKARQKQAAEQGHAAGARFTPFGYRRTRPGVLEIDPEQADIVRQLSERVLAGEPLESIARDLTARGVQTSSGATKWFGTTVKQILVNPTIAGLRRQHGEVIGDATWEPIVSRETYELLSARLKSATRGAQPTKYLLSGGLLRCGRCGSALRSHTGKNSTTGVVYRSYACLKADRYPQACGKMSVSAASVEGYVIGLVLGALEGADLREVKAARSGNEAARLTAQIQSDERAAEELAQDFGNGLIRRAEWLAARNPIESRLSEARRKLSMIAHESDALPDDLFHVDLEVFTGLDFPTKKALVELLLDHIVVNPATVKGRRFDESRLSPPAWKA